AALNVKQHVAIRIGTLSKAIGAHGGFVAGPEVLIEYLINFCRPLIFSTAGSPQTIAAANHHLGRIMKDATLTRRVHANTKRLRESIRKLHQNVETVNDAVENAMRRDGKAPFDSVPRDSIAYWESVVPIVPVILGDNQRAVDASRRLADAGYHVPAIRPPTVPENTSRLRISVSAAHSESQIRGLAKQLCGREIR
ncbi:MAG: aminotransferase class I/II-fold pyridoxal phosphate-dependent enzyme, partial [Planctomycetota bacterium]